MSNNQKIVVWAGAFVALGVLVYFLSGGSFGKKRQNWWEHYDEKKETPYGTTIIYGLLADYFPEEKMQTISDSLSNFLSNKNTSGSYFYLGQNLWLDSARMQAVLDFVERGNDAFIISPYIPHEMLDSASGRQCIQLSFEQDSMYYPGYDSLAEEGLDTIYYPDYDSLDEEGQYPIYHDSIAEEEQDSNYYYDEYYGTFYFLDTLAVLNLTHPLLKDSSGYTYTFRDKNGEQEYLWNYLPPDLFCEHQEKLVPLGIIGDSLVNFVTAKYGNGHFYFHTTPLAFTNYHLVREDGRIYTEKVLTHLEKSPILWDATEMEFDFNFPGRNRGFGQSPLKYVLSQPSLAWAWYLLLGMAVLYLVFRAKRRQRMIPVLEKNENTSLEFIKTIGRLYFLQNNHRQLALEKMTLFLGFIRDRYHIPTKEINPVFKKQLSVKSEIPLEVIEAIFRMHDNIERSKFASENTLTTLHKNMEQFYLHCK